MTDLSRTEGKEAGLALEPGGQTNDYIRQRLSIPQLKYRVHISNAEITFDYLADEYLRIQGRRDVISLLMIKNDADGFFSPVFKLDS